jgi:hypothetical protein
LSEVRPLFGIGDDGAAVPFSQNRKRPSVKAS